jgi:hypothetical protein
MAAEKKGIEKQVVGFIDIEVDVLENDRHQPLSRDQSHDHRAGRECSQNGQSQTGKQSIIILGIVIQLCHTPRP